MKIAFSTLGCPKWTLEEILGRAKEYGYEGIELRGLEGVFLLPEYPRFQGAEFYKTKKLIDESGIEIACVSASASFATNDPEEWEKNREEAKAYIELAERLGSKLVRVFGGRVPEGVAWDDCISYMADRLNEVGDFAKEHNVTIVLETHDNFILGKSIAEVMKGVTSEGVGVLWDVHHPYKLGGEPLEETMNYLKEYVKHTHVKDSKGKGENPELVLLGEGDVPLQEIVNLLKENGYDGYLSLEWEKAWHPEIAEPEVAFPQAAKKLREYIAGK